MFTNRATYAAVGRSVLSGLRANSVRAASDRASFYAIKNQMDEYIYFETLQKKWRPLVYRAKNADELTSLDAVDKQGRPIVPRKFPGIPSKTKFQHFIDELMVPEELDLVKKTVTDLDKHLLRFLSPSIINSLLYKSAQFGTLGRDIIYVYQLPNYKANKKFSSRNIEAIIVLRAVQAAKLGVTDLDWTYKRLRQVFKQNKSADTDTLLVDAARLALYYQLKANGNQTPLLAHKIEDLAAKLLAREMYSVAANADADADADANAAQAYNRWEHAYTVLTLLKQNAQSAGGADDVIAKIAPFVQSVDELKAAAGVTKTVLERLEEGATFATAAPAEDAPAAEETK